jgi:hypothetical protein
VQYTTRVLTLTRPSPFTFASPSLTVVPAFVVLAHKTQTQTNTFLHKNKQRFIVGKLIEIHPIGKHRDKLGYNMNKGTVIALRLREPSGHGFRSLNQNLSVLSHELAHNRISPHNAAFHRLDREIRAKIDEYNRDTSRDFLNTRGKRVGGGGTHGKSAKEMFLKVSNRAVVCCVPLSCLQIDVSLINMIKPVRALLVSRLRQHGVDRRSWRDNTRQLQRQPRCPFFLFRFTFSIAF